MTELAWPIPTEEGEPITVEALQLAAFLARQGISFEARGGCLVLSALDGVMMGIRDQGHHVGALFEHAGALYRLALMTAAASDQA